MRKPLLLLLIAALSLSAITCGIAMSTIKKRTGKTGPIIVIKPRGGGAGEYLNALYWEVTPSSGTPVEIPATYSVRAHAKIDRDLVERVRAYDVGVIGVDEPPIRLLAGDLKLNIQRDGGNVKWTVRLPGTAATELTPATMSTWTIPYEWNYFDEARLEYFSLGSWNKAGTLRFSLYP